MGLVKVLLKALLEFKWSGVKIFKLLIIKKLIQYFLECFLIYFIGVFTANRGLSRLVWALVEGAWRLGFTI